MTWKQIQQITLQKLFATSAGALQQDDSTKDYLAAMPAAANEGMMLLALRGHAQALTASVVADTNVQGVNLSLQIPNFIEIADGVYKKTENGLIKVDGWSCNMGVLHLPHDAKGEYIVRYMALPTMISQDTSPDAQIELSSAACVLLPLYIASQLYKDDDISLSGAYRNEFEAGAEQISGVSTQQQSGFISASGWCT